MEASYSCIGELSTYTAVVLGKIQHIKTAVGLKKTKFRAKFGHKMRSFQINNHPFSVSSS